MKLNARQLTLLFAILLFAAASCTHHRVVVVAPKKAPPGQVKKATGSQSAKAYAPGQQKKKH